MKATVVGIINYSSRDWYGKTNLTSGYTGGRCTADSWLIQKFSLGGKLPFLLFLLEEGLVINRSGRVVARWVYNESPRGGNVWLSELSQRGQYVEAPALTEQEISDLLSPDYGDGNSNPCPRCGRWMEYGSCRWTDCR